jgi:hypothetical protein
MPTMDDKPYENLEFPSDSTPEEKKRTPEEPKIGS